MSDTENKEMATNSDSKNLYRVGMKVPHFWPEEPALWFAQLEGQFAISNITVDATKFYHVVAQLDYNIAAEVKDIIQAPPATDKYNKIKNELISRLSQSNEKKIKQLLVHEELGDRKPSQFLRHLKSLGGQNIPDDFIKTIWCSRLPANIQTVVASQMDFSLDQLAIIADRIHEVAPTTDPPICLPF